MIFDKLENLIKYKGLYSSLDSAIDYLSNADLRKLKDGRNDINENVYINVINGKLIEEKDGLYELHKKYLDLHVDISGCEKILFCDNMNSVSKDYTEEDDYALVTGDKTVECCLDDNHFAICMIDEPHLPCVKCDDTNTIKKAIVKIRV